MNLRDLLKNEDAVSISVGFILMFSVTVIIFTATIISFYSLSQSNEKIVMGATFRIIGAGLATKITTVDTLVNITNSYGGTVNSLEYEFSMPASVADKSYSVNLTNSTYQIIIQSDNGAITYTPLNISANFNAVHIYSGAENYKLTYDKPSNSLNIVEE
jgi:hypothetical protein